MRASIVGACVSSARRYRRSIRPSRRAGIGPDGRPSFRALLEELPLNALITHRVPFDQAAAAYELLDRRAGECLQVVLDYV